jgi:hypothetical protein
MCLYGDRDHIYSTLRKKDDFPGKVYNLIKKKEGPRSLVSQRRNRSSNHQSDQLDLIRLPVGGSSLARYIIQR